MSSEPRRRVPILAILAIAGAALVLLAATAALEAWLDADRLERRLASALDAAGGAGTSDVRIDEVETSLLGRSLHVRGLEIRITAGPGRAPGAGAVSETGPDGSDRPWLDARVREVTVRGIDALRLVRGAGYGAGSLHVRAPRVTIWSDPDRASGDGAEDTAEDRAARDGAGARPGDGRGRPLTLKLADGLPELVLGELRVDSAEFAYSVRGRGPAGRHHLWNASASLEGIRVDSAAATAPDRTLFARGIRFRAGDYTFVSSDSLTRVRVSGLRGRAGGCVRADSVTVRPTVDLPTFLRRVETRKDRVSTFIGPVSACELELSALLARRAVLAGRVEVDSFEVGVYTDLRLPPPPGDAPAWRPHTLMRGAPPIAIELVRARAGTIRYRERAPGSDEPGVFTLGDVAFRITDLAGPGGPGEPGVTRVEMDALLMGRARSSSTLELPLDAGELRFRYRGGVGALDATAFNDLLPPLTGVRIEGGQMDTAWFDYEVRGDTAFGGVVPLYRDLDIAIVGQEDEGQGLFESLKTLIADARLATRNPPEPGADPRVGTVEHAPRPQDPFFTVVWGALRSGLMDAIGM